MLCPTDGSTLVMSERSGVEIDYCPQCRGVWLDRGELDKILEKVTADLTAPGPAQPAHPQYQPPQQGYPPQYQQPYPGQQPYYGKKKSHWLTELFD